MESLTEKQKRVLDYLCQVVSLRKYPPSVREICQALGFQSSSTAHAHLEALEKKGYIRKDSSKPRAIEILIDSEPKEKLFNIKPLPVIGEVTAGEPILADQNIEGYFPLPSDYLSICDGSFLLRVKGDSMIGAGINHGDLVIVRPQKNALNGEIIVALIDNEATVKRFYKDDEWIRLQPENSSFAPSYHRDITILGLVVGLFRKM